MLGLWGLVPLWLGSAFHQFLVNDTNLFHCASYEISTQASTCFSFGEPHVLTFDGVAVDHGGYGDYYLVYSSSPSGVNIVSRQAECTRSVTGSGATRKLNCNRAFSIQSNNIYVTITYDDVALAVITKYYNGNWTVFVGDTFIPGFGNVSVISLENMGYQVDVTIGSATVSMSWFGDAAGGIIKIPSQLQPAGTSGLCGFSDGCQYNDLVLRLRSDYWWNTTLDNVVNSTIYLSGAMDEGYGYVYAGPTLPPHQPLLPVTASRATISQYFASSWLLAGDEAVRYFGDTLGSKALQQADIDQENPPPNSACFPNEYIPTDVSPPKFLLQACLRDVAAGGTQSARGAHEVFLALCDGFCAAQLFANPNEQLLAEQCGAVCAPPAALQLHQNYSLDVPVTFIMGEDSTFSPLAVGGRYIAELQTTDQCEIDTTSVLVDVICVDGSAPTISAGANKTVKRGWYGFPKVEMHGTSVGRVEQLHWALIDWPGNAQNLPSPTLYREYSRFPWWVPDLSGRHVLEMAVYDGCAISRVQVEVIVQCAPFASVSVDGSRSVLWASSTNQSFETLLLNYELEYSSFRVLSDIPMEWSLLFLATVPIPGANASNRSAPQTMQAYIEPDVGSSLPYGTGEIELTFANDTDKVYTIFTYESALYPDEVLNQSSTSSISTTTQAPNMMTSLTNTNEWGLYSFRSGSLQTSTSTSSHITTVAKDYLKSRREAICIVHLQGVTSPNLQADWTPVAMGRDCVGFFRVQVATTADQVALDPCNAIQDQVVVDISCGAAPTALVSAPTQVTFNYTSNSFTDVRVLLEAVYDTLQRTLITYTYSAVLIPPTGSALPAVGDLVIESDPDGQAVSFLPDFAGRFEVQMSASNGCEETISTVSVLAVCSEPSNLVVNMTQTHFDDSQGLYNNNRFVFDIDGSYSGLNHNNPLPPVITSIVRVGPALPAAVPIPLYYIAGTGPYEVFLGISGIYDVTVSFTNNCGQKFSKTTAVTATSSYNGGAASCGYPNKIQTVSARNITDPYEHFLLNDVLFSPPPNTDFQTWTLRSVPFGSTAELSSSTAQFLTPDVAGVYIVDLVATGGLGWCTDTLTLTAQDCSTPGLIIQGGKRTVSVALGMPFILEFIDADNDMTQYRWSSHNSPVPLYQNDSQTLTFSEPGVFTFLLEYDTVCTTNWTKRVTITLTVTCPATIAAAAFVGSSTPATVTFASQSFPRIYFNGAGSYLQGRDPLSPEFANSTWVVTSAPANSVYAAGTSTIQHTAVNSTEMIVDSGIDGVDWIQRLNVTATSTTVQSWRPVLPLSQLAGLWTSFLDPDVTGTYTLLFTLTDYCGASTSSLTLNAVCTPASAVVSVAPVSAYMSGPSANPGNYVPTNGQWLTPYQLTDTARRVVKFAEFPASLPIVGRFIFRQVDSSSPTEIYLELTAPGMPGNYSWEVLNGTCASKTVWNTNTNPLSSNMNSTTYKANCGSGNDNNINNNCQTGDLTGKFGALPLGNTLAVHDFQDDYLPVRTTDSLGDKSIGIRLTNSPTYLACAPVVEYQTYYASLSRGWGSRVNLDASASTAGGGSSDLSYKWTWFFSGAAVAGNYMYNTFADHQTDSVANALGSLEQSSSAVASFMIHQKGVYAFQLDIWNGCSKSTARVVIDSDCGAPGQIIQSQTLRVSLTQTSPALTVAPFLSFDLAASTSQLVVRQPSLMQWRVVTYIDPSDLNNILRAHQSSAHFTRSASFYLLAAVLLTVFVGPIH